MTNRISNASVDKTVRAALDREIEHIRRDMVYFMERYVKIEDKASETGEIIVPFQLWQAQKDALLSIDRHKFNIVLKARQLGLTWCCLAYTARYMILHPGCLVIALSRTEKEAKELSRRLGSVILGHMPELVDEEGSRGRFRVNVRSTEIELIDRNGRVSTFSVFTSSKGAGRSFTADVLFIDEWAFQQWAEEIWASAFPTINRPNGGKVIGISTIERGTLFEELWTEENAFNKIFIPWSADPRRTQEWYEETKANIGDTIMAEYPATPEEALTIPGGAFFPEFKEEIHCKSYVHKENSTRFVSFDFGLDGLAALWYEMDENGSVQVYRELYTSDKNVEEAAAEIIKANCGEKIDRWFAPPDMWNRNRDSGVSTAEKWRRLGIPLTRTSNELEQGWLNVKSWLRVYETKNEQTGEVTVKSDLTVDPECCPNLVRCLKKIQKDKNRPNITAHDPHELTHLPDSLRAFCQGRPKFKGKPVKKKEYAFDKYLKPKSKSGEVVRII
ncbi:MAG: hypothetical protein ACOX7J_02965 [Bacillota bacterium]|jgi:hypothetical protein